MTQSNFKKLAPTGAALTLLTLLSACSFAPIRVAVPDITLPGNDSLGLVCYQEVTEDAPANFRRASYRATATYSSSVPGNEVRVQVFGRTSEPGNLCVDLSSADLALSEPFALRAGEAEAVEVGAGVYGNAFADLIVNDRYWLGATVAGGVLLSAGERITLTDGEIVAHY